MEREAAVRSAINLRQRLMLGTALATSAVTGGYRGYVRRAYADCTGAAGTYACSGMTTTTQTLKPGTSLTVTTAPGFGIDTTGSGGNAFDLRGTGGLTFTDDNHSTITGNLAGINAGNYGSGALSITTTGTVTGGTGNGIYAYAGTNTTGLTIKATDDVSGGTDGIDARVLGYSGALSITVSGTVTGGTGDGIHTSLQNAVDDLTIRAVGVSGGANGIYAANSGQGVLSITATGTVRGGTGDGIRALNYGTDLTVEAADVGGGTNGIRATNYRSGALSITTSGAVEGTGFDGIYSVNRGTNLTIEAAAVSGGANGIHAHQHGTGALSITTSGAVTGNGNYGIYAINDSPGAPTTVTVEDGSAVNGSEAGVQLVSGTGRAASVENAGSITGPKGIVSKAGATTISNTGAIAGTAGAAIDLSLAGGPNTVNQHAGTITGDIQLSPAADTVNVTGGAIAGNIYGLGSASLNFALGSGTFTFAAPFTITDMADVNINSGTVIVNGSISSTAVTVNTGARLGGTGTVSTATIASGGTIAPGNSIGTLNVDGPVTFADGSVYEVELGSGGTSDLIDATHTADIQGGTVLALAESGFFRLGGPRYTILTAAGGRTGEFDTLVEGAPFVDLSLFYDPNNVYLGVARNQVSFCEVAHTFNHCSTGNGAESQGPGGPIHDAVAGVPDEETARRALDALSGEMHASIEGALLEDSRFVREAAIDRIRSAFGGVAAPSLPVMGYGPDEPTPEQQEALAREGKSATTFAPAASDTDRFTVWARGFGSWGERDSDGNAADFERSSGGLFIGADALVADTWRVGLVTGYSRSSFDADDRASAGESDSYHLGLFGGTEWGNLGLRLGAAHTWHNIETSRSIVFPGFADSAEASYEARTAQVFGELGYKIDSGGFGLEPFANLAYVNVHTDDFTEGGGAAALTSASSDTDATFTTLGLRVATDLPLGGTKATARGMIGWRHAFGDVTPLADLAFTGGDAFTIAGTPIAENALVLEAGFDLGLSEKASLGFSYSGQIGDGAQDHGFTADLSVKF